MGEMGVSTRKPMKQQQMSLRNFFRVDSTPNNTVSLVDRGVRDRKRTAKSVLLTPPTPVSPPTSQTPPTAQTAHFATPPTPNSEKIKDDSAVFGKAKRATTTLKSLKRISRTDSPMAHVKEKKRSLEQTYLDLGQQDFGKRTICSTCGMLFVHGLNEDSQQHSRICNDYLKGVPFNTPNARVVASDSTGWIVEIRPADSYTFRTKLERVREIVDLDLGFVPSTKNAPQTAYLYIVNKHVVGLATAEMIQHAFVLHNSLERSSKPQKAMVGVHQLWVHSKFRKQGVAKCLVDTLRAKLVFGLTVPKEMVAFSSPTEAGSRFARHYVSGDDSSKEVLVYDCC